MSRWQTALQGWAQDLLPGRAVHVEAPRIDESTRLRMRLWIDGAEHQVQVHYPGHMSLSTALTDLGQAVRGLIEPLRMADAETAARWHEQVEPVGEFWEAGSGAQYRAAGAGRECLRTPAG